MPASRFLKKVKKPAKFQSAVSMCQFLSPGTLLYYVEQDSRSRASKKKRVLIKKSVWIAGDSECRAAAPGLPSACRTPHYSPDDSHYRLGPILVCQERYTAPTILLLGVWDPFPNFPESGHGISLFLKTRHWHAQFSRNRTWNAVRHLTSVFEETNKKKKGWKKISMNSG